MELKYFWFDKCNTSANNSSPIIFHFNLNCVRHLSSQLELSPSSLESKQQVLKTNSLFANRKTELRRPPN